MNKDNKDNKDKQLRTSLVNFQKKFGFKKDSDKSKNSDLLIEMLTSSQEIPGYKVIVYCPRTKDKYELYYNPILLFLQGHALANVFSSKLSQMSTDETKLSYEQKIENGFLLTEDLFNIINGIATCYHK